MVTNVLRSTKKNVRRILENQIYTGIIEHKNQIYNGLHEAIIKKDIWQKEKDVPIWNLLRDELAKNGDFREFMRKDKQLNDLRKEFWGEHNKELYEMVKHFYE